MSEIDLEKIYSSLNADSSEDMKSALKNLEKVVRTSNVYDALSKNDAIEQIINFCTERVVAISSFLENQTSEELKDDKNIVIRCKEEVRRQMFAWFIMLFTSRRKIAKVAGMKIEEITKSLKE